MNHNTPVTVVMRDAETNELIDVLVMTVEDLKRIETESIKGSIVTVTANSQLKH